MRKKKNVHAMCNIHIPTELPFCTSPLLVGIGGGGEVARVQSTREDCVVVVYG